MSDERLQELGLPRREFLKKAAVGAFAAPLIVSFGLAGTAEAAPTCYPNQTFSNQTYTVFHELTTIAFYVWEGEQESLVSSRIGQQLRSKYLTVAADVLDDNTRDFCRRLADLQRLITQQSGRAIDPGFASDRLAEINSLQSAYCQCD